MLLQLHIRNFVLVENVELNVLPGLTVLTGETGAGKSLLLDALGAVLGDKAQPFWVRPNCDKADVTATFDVSALPCAQAWLNDQDLEADNTCILRRVITSEGKSKAFINGIAVTLTQLRQLSEQLVELHSQHEHHALLLPKTQLSLLDTWAQHQSLVNDVQQAWKNWHQLTQHKQTLLTASHQRQEKTTLLRFQDQELTPFEFEAHEYEQLSSDHTKLAHAQDIVNNLAQAHDALDGDRQSVISGLSTAIKHLATISQFDAAFNNLLQQCQNAYAECEDAASSIQHQARHVTVDEGRLQEIDRRLTDYHRLAKKYLTTPEQLWQTVQDIRQQLDALTQQDAQLDQLDEAIEGALTQYRAVADQLSAHRQHAAPTLANAIIEQLHELGMNHARLAWQLTQQTTPQPQGWDSVEVVFSANPGQVLYPMAKIASGGELSRISLAIEVCVADHIQLPVLVFDEVDVGVGGGVADRIGQKLAAIAQQKQVLCITHQAQVAAWGAQHWHIQKVTDGANTHTDIAILNDRGREDELSRMIGTGEVDDATRQHAQHMLSRAKAGR
jgi:DNA repair protein RecN (Recombination protein N)